MFRRGVCKLRIYAFYMNRALSIHTFFFRFPFFSFHLSRALSLSFPSYRIGNICCWPFYISISQLSLVAKACDCDTHTLFATASCFSCAVLFVCLVEKTKKLRTQLDVCPTPRRVLPFQHTHTSLVNYASNKLFLLLHLKKGAHCISYRITIIVPFLRLCFFFTACLLLSRSLPQLRDT